jgi:hypothetical protein
MDASICNEATRSDYLYLASVEYEKQKKTAKIISLNTRVKIAVAAAIVGAIISGTTIRLYQQGTKIADLNTNTEKSNSSETYGEEYVNDYIDYAMVDDTDIYEYISEN